MSALSLSGVIIGAGFVISILVAVWANKFKIEEEEEKKDDKVAPTEKKWNSEEERIAHMQKTMNESLEARSATS